MIMSKISPMQMVEPAGPMLVTSLESSANLLPIARQQQVVVATDGNKDDECDRQGQPMQLCPQERLPHAGRQPPVAYREVLHTIRTVSTASEPIIAVAIVRVNQVNSKLAGPGAAIAQWPNVFATEASGKLNDQ